jgi:cytochrome c-type biogenesis protein CcmH
MDREPLPGHGFPAATARRRRPASPEIVAWNRLLPALALLWPLAAGAVLPSEQLADQALEARAREISRELRCQVCHNQSIDDSNAPLAADLRRLVRDRLTAGDSDAQVLAFVQARYGDYVRLTPPFRLDTLLLWLGPALILLAAALGVGFWYRRRAAAPEAAALDADEERALARLLEDKR